MEKCDICDSTIRRFIKVKVKASGKASGNVRANHAKGKEMERCPPTGDDSGDNSGGIDVFDAYIATSGLEPKQYQRDGVAFCLRREMRRKGGIVCGGIIADEMGLGKTMMMMGLILANLAMFKRTLIECQLRWWHNGSLKSSAQLSTLVLKPILSFLCFMELLRNAVWCANRWGVIQKQSGATDLPRMPAAPPPPPPQ